MRSDCSNRINFVASGGARREVMTDSNFDMMGSRAATSPPEHGASRDRNGAPGWAGFPFPSTMRLLVVECDRELRQAICTCAAGWTFALPPDSVAPIATFKQIREADSVSTAITRLSEVADVLIVSTQLGAESGLTVVEHASRLDQAPATLALSDHATAAVGFQLAKLGARGCLGTPFAMDELRAAIQAILAEPPDLAASARAQVGYRHIHTVQDEVKCAMLKRAFTLEDGNITRAARRLGVTRTAVQQMLDRYGVPRSLATPAPSEGPESVRLT